VDQVLADIAAEVRRPVMANLPFGHTTPKMTLPVGLRVRVDAAMSSLEFAEGAVS
jgi:muramoyltetrapeptide carboxypeptidase LdcA involved in peptidoglycan recycling